MISYVENEKKFNFRVGGIITNEDERMILLHRLETFDFWLLPGGRVELLEGTETAIIREIKEELGEDVKLEKLMAITESFFELKNVTYHEVAFNYKLKLPRNSKILKMKEEFAGVEGEKYRYKWFDRELLNQLSVKPSYLVPVLQKMPKELVHIIRDERIKN